MIYIQPKIKIIITIFALFVITINKSENLICYSNITKLDKYNCTVNFQTCIDQVTFKS